MGLRSPFGYVGRDSLMLDIFLDLLHKLCFNCGTNSDFRGGCAGCPTGGLIQATKNYILAAHESDKHLMEYASKKWIQIDIKRGDNPKEARERAKEHRTLAQNFVPQCRVLRKIKKQIARISPTPCYDGSTKRRKDYKRLVQLAEEYNKCICRNLGIKPQQLWEGKRRMEV